MKAHPRYYALEGVDGVGKSYTIKNLLKCCPVNTVYFIKEPDTNTTLGRLAMQSFENERMNPWQKLNLALAAHSEAASKAAFLLEKNPNLVLISDRCYLSTFVYNVEEEWLRDDSMEEVLASLVRVAQQPVKPNIIHFTGMPLKEVNNRLRERVEKPLYEEYEYMKRNWDRYLTLYQRGRKPFVAGIAEEGYHPLQVYTPKVTGHDPFMSPRDVVLSILNIIKGVTDETPAQGHPTDFLANFARTYGRVKRRVSHKGQVRRV